MNNISYGKSSVFIWGETEKWTFPAGYMTEKFYWIEGHPASCRHIHNVEHEINMWGTVVFLLCTIAVSFFHSLRARLHIYRQNLVKLLESTSGPALYVS